VNEASFNPWLSMWSQPRATIRHIIDTDPTRDVIALAAVAGILQSLDRAAMNSVGDSLSLPAVFAIALFVGPLSGILGLYLLGFLLRITGRWIGGTGTPEGLRAAIAWANVPYLWLSLLWIPELLLFGSELFTTATPRMDESTTLTMLFLIFAAVQLVLGIWIMIVFLMSVGEAQGFSAWRALGNALLAVLLMLAPLVLLGLLVGALGLIAGTIPG